MKVEIIMLTTKPKIMYGNINNLAKNKEISQTTNNNKNNVNLFNIIIEY